jgi:hypothetical protein
VASVVEHENTTRAITKGRARITIQLAKGGVVPGLRSHIARSKEGVSDVHRGSCETSEYGAAPRREDQGTERLAACWEVVRKIQEVVFTPYWTKYAKATPFKRNDKPLELGVTENLADKARMLLTSVWRFGGGGA